MRANWAEREAEEYFQNQGFKTVSEPDGNIPPDLLLNGAIAVEVRELNENLNGVGLDVDSIRLHDAFRDVMAPFGPPDEGVSWWVSASFRRPLPKMRELKADLRRSLSEFMSRGEITPSSDDADHDFDIRISRANIRLENRFDLAGIHDLDAGGAVTAILTENTNRFIEEKARKIAPYRDRYPVWWLALVNNTRYRLHPEETDIFLSSVIGHTWSKLIILGLPERSEVLEISPSKEAERGFEYSIFTAVPRPPAP